MEHHVAAAFAVAFPTAKIDLSSDFFDLGGDSLSLVTLCSQLEQDLGQEVHPSLLLYHSTVAELAAELSGAADLNAAN